METTMNHGGDVERGPVVRRSWARRVWPWLVPIVALPQLIGGALWLTQEAGRDPTEEWYPRVPGTTWTYTSTTDGEDTGLVTRRVADRATVAEGVGDSARGVDVDVVETRYQNFLGRGSPLTTYEYVAPDGGMLHQYGTGGRGYFIEQQPSQPIAIIGADKGRTERWAGTTGGDPASTTLTVVSQGEVTVAGRRFDDCFQQRSRENVGGDTPSTTIVERWYCKNTGMVKYTERYRPAAPDVGGGDEVVVTLDLVAFASADHGFVSALSVDQTLEVGEDNAPSASDKTRSAVPWTDLRSEKPVYPPVGQGSRLIMATDTGALTAMDSRTGEMAWRTRVTSAVVAPPTVAGTDIIVADGSRSVLSLRGDSGAANWIKRLPDLVTGVAAVTDHAVVVPVADGTVRALSRSNGQQVWKSPPLEAAPLGVATGPGRAYVTDTAGTITAFDLSDDDEPVWQRALHGAALGAPVLEQGLVLLSDEQGFIEALDADTGHLVWSQHRDGLLTGMTVGTGEVVLLLGGDRLEALELSTGSSRWVRDTVESTVPPLLFADEVVILAASQELRTYRLPTGAPGATLDLGRDAEIAGVDSVADVPLSIVADCLVVTIRRRPSGTYLLGFPSLSEPAGVRFTAVSRTPVDALPAGQAEGHTDAYSFLNSNGALSYVSEGRAVVVPGVRDATWLAASEQPGLVFVGAARGVRAVDPATGSVRWRSPLTPRVPGVPIGIGAGAVALPPPPGGRLEVRDQVTGNLRWARMPFGALGAASAGAEYVSSPVVLPDGDVIYGEGARLARFEGSSGRPTWKASVGAATFLNIPAEASGSRFYLLVVDGNRAYIQARRTRSGRLLWRKPFNAAQPLAARGRTVVGVDATGRVHGFDGRNGKALWSVPASSGITGVPQFVGGVVVVLETGYTANLVNGARRLVAYDPRSGRFLAARHLTPIARDAPLSVFDDHVLVLPGTGATPESAVTMDSFQVAAP